jgi:hypothetical protein
LEFVKASDLFGRIILYKLELLNWFYSLLIVIYLFKRIY